MCHISVHLPHQYTEYIIYVLRNVRFLFYTVKNDSQKFNNCLCIYGFYQTA